MYATTYKVHLLAAHQLRVVRIYKHHNASVRPSVLRNTYRSLREGAAVTVKLAVAFGGPWIEQLITTGVIFSCLHFVYRCVDVFFVLLLKNTFETEDLKHVSVKELKRLVTVIRGEKNEVARNNMHGDGEGGGEGCFTFMRKGRRNDNDAEGHSSATAPKTATGGAAAAHVEAGVRMDRLERGSGVESATRKEQQLRHQREQEELRQMDWMRERKLSSNKKSLKDATSADLDADGAKSVARLQAAHTVSHGQTLLIAKKILKVGAQGDVQVFLFPDSFIASIQRLLCSLYFINVLYLYNVRIRRYYPSIYYINRALHYIGVVIYMYMMR